MLRTLAGRLTLASTLLFCVLALIMYLVIADSMKNFLINNVDEELRSETVEFANLMQNGGIEAIQRMMSVENASEDVEAVFIRIFDRSHQPVLTTNLASWPVLPNARWGENMEVLETLTAPAYSNPARVIWSPLPDGYGFQMGMFLSDSEELMAHFHRVFTGIFIVVLMIGISIGHLLTRKLLLSLQLVRAAADRISAGNLDAEIPKQNGVEEVNGLIRSVNHMQSRIRTLINELQDVTNNIAHDLRSPVTRMRGLAETSLTGEQSLDDYRSLAGAVVEECDTLVGMINTMLDIAETDAGIRPLKLQPMDIVASLADITELYSTVAEDHSISVTLKVTQQPLMIMGERSRLQRALANLLDNALKFTPAGGRILVKAGKEGDQVVIEIEDNGRGISAQDLPRVCERYYRADHSRSTAGSGLGLSLVQAVVRVHGGKLTIKSEINQGTQVRIQLPGRNDAV